MFVDILPKYFFLVTSFLALGQVLCLESEAAQPMHLEERTGRAGEPQSSLPEIYLIGDSIRMAYCNDVARSLEGRAAVRWPDGNCANSQNILINLGWWRKYASTPVVIQFNCGHWDASHWDGDSEPITSLDEYRKNIRLIVRRLKRYYPSATIVYATTTPMNPSGVSGGNHRTTEEIRRYNQVGVEAARSEGALVNDLYSYVADWPASDYADYCHFTKEANVRLGKMVGERLLPLVPPFNCQPSEGRASLCK